MASPLVVYYVTAHGFGHATRAAAVCRELEARGARVVVRSAAPARLFSEEEVRAEVQAVDTDPGLVMKDTLTVDIPASLGSFERLAAGWDALRAEEAAWLRRAGADAVLSDAGALAVDAAAEARVPSAVVSNFTWDWIVEPWAAADARWERVRARLAAAYARAGILLRLPLGGGVPAVARSADMPLVVRRPRLGRDAVRRALGLDPADPTPVAAFSLGGGSWSAPASPRRERLPGWKVVAYGPRPEALEADWVRLETHGALRHCDVLAAADAVLSKPGYGTFAEALAARVPVLSMARPEFRESPVMMDAFRGLGRLREIPLEDFTACRWGRHLAGLRAAEDPWADLALDGAGAVAERALMLADAVHGR